MLRFSVSKYTKQKNKKSKYRSRWQHAKTLEIRIMNGTKNLKEVRQLSNANAQDKPKNMFI